MKEFSIVHPLVLSFFSKPLYRDVARNWRGFGAAYLLALVALSSIPAVLKVQRDVAEYLRTEAPAYIRQVPVITVEKGSVTVDAPQPFTIIDEKTKAPKIIIDTTGTITSLAGSEAVALVTKKSLIIKKDGQDTRSFDLSFIDRQVIDKKWLYDFMELMEDLVAVVLYPFAVIISFFQYAVEVLVLSFIGVLLGRSLNAPLQFPALLRVAAIAITPATVIGTLLMTAGVLILYWPLISFLISLSYLVFALKGNT